MEYPKKYPCDISKSKDGALMMTIGEGVGMCIYQCGKVIETVFDDEYSNIMYETRANYPDKPAYCGQINWRTGEPEGLGKFTYYDRHEESYEGYVRAGKPDGNGILTYKNGMTENGFFKDGTFTGTQTHNCGTSITGLWDNGSLDKVTSVEFPDGRRIVETKPHEDNRFFLGKYFLPGQGVFIGTIWKTGFEPHNGTMKFFDGHSFFEGRCYTGECRFDRRFSSTTLAAHGLGKMVLLDGTSYTSKWVRGIVCDNFRGTLHLVGEMAGEIVGFPHVGVMSKYLSRDDFVGFAIAVEKVTCEAVQEQEEQEQVSSEAEDSDESEDDDPSPVLQLLLTMREQVRVRKEQFQREAWRKHALSAEEVGDNVGEAEQDGSDASSEADEELVQRKMERTYTAAEDNAPENLKCAAGTCGSCQAEFLDGDQYFKCSTCETQCYCNGVCQRNHWQEHKKTCKKAVEEDD